MAVWFKALRPTGNCFSSVPWFEFGAGYVTSHHYGRKSDENLNSDFLFGIRINISYRYMFIRYSLSSILITRSK